MSGRVAALAAVLVAGAAPGCAREEPSRSRAAEAPPPRNVLLISLDTTRADSLAPYGAAEERTPALARLAREGIVFETAIAPVPLTLPSHATLLTGLDPARHSVRDNSAYTLPPSAVTLAETLREAGWRTFAAIASVVLLPRFGLDQGFDRYDVEGLVVTTGPEHERQADAVANAALQLLPGPEPFFGFVHFYDPHRPYRAPAELERRFGDPYAAEVHLADLAVGRLLDALRAGGRLDRTIVVVTADHGESLGEHGESTHGMLVHDATQRVPLFVRLPGAAPRRVGGLVAALADVMLTLLELCGVSAPPGLDGRSLVPALRGAEMEPGDAYLESLYPRRAFDFAPLYGVRTLEWKLVLGAEPHLWRVGSDPGERWDVASDHPEVVEALTHRIHHLRDGRGEALSAQEQQLTDEELQAFGGLGYVASLTGDDPDDEASGRPDPYRDIADAEEASLATLLADQGKHEAAIARLVPLARRLPGTSHVRHLLGALYGERGEHEKALAELLAAAKLRPRSPDVQLQAALAAWFVKRPDLVRSHLEAATSLPGCEPRAFVLLAETLVDAREPAAARAVLLRLLGRSDLSPEDRGAAQAALRRLDG